jgi:hypothetical protein
MAHLPDLERSLEELVDKHGLTMVIDVLVNVCDDKAEHLRSNWQDGAQAKSWDKCAKILDKASASLCREIA